MLRKSKSILPGKWLLIIFLIAVNFSLLSQPFTETEKSILEKQDLRVISGINWKDILKTDSENNRLRLYSAIENINDSAAYIVLKDIISNSHGNDKELFASLTGNFEKYGSAEYIRQLIEENRQNEKLLPSLFFSLCYAGNINDLDLLKSIAPLKGDQETVFSDALVILAIRKIIDKDLLDMQIGLINQKNYNYSKLLSDMVYSLNRMNNKDLLINYRDLLLNIQKDNNTDYRSRMWTYSALGKLLDTSVTEVLINALNTESDWRVRVNIANALSGKLPDMNSPLIDKMINVLTQHAMQDNSAHVSIVCLQSLGKLFAISDTRNPELRKIQQSLLYMLSPSSNLPWQVKAEALKTYGRIFIDEAKNDLVQFFNQTDNYDLKSAAVSAFAYMEDPMVYKELRQMISDDVMKYNELHPNKDGSMIGSNDLAKLYRAFVGTLVELDDKMDKENRNIIRLILTEFSSSKDAPLTDVCITNLQDSIYMDYRNETCGILTFDYPYFILPRDKDVMLMYIEAWGNMKFAAVESILTENLKSKDYDIAKASSDALQKITGKDFSGKITAQKYRIDQDWDFIDKLGEKKYADIKTNIGNIKIELDPIFAPFTVQNFIKLSEKGYYNNTIFHRVVPNFVIQGGDPTGTGYGGPGYSIRSEFSPLPFDEYTIGMASSGKDTEGSQFFITHSPQPHLDGKYTVFGKVIEGKETVDKIQIGDYIEAITFSQSK